MPPSLRTEPAREFAPARAGEYAARVPLLRAAAAQVGAVALVLLPLGVLAPSALQGQELVAWAGAQGLAAAALGRILRMDAWWLPMHALFAPGLVWALGFGLPPLYALGAFLLLSSLYWGAGAMRVPLFLSSRAATRALADLLPRERRFSFVDLGCGLGGVLTGVARARPAGRYFGIEAAPLPCLFARLRAALSGRPCAVSWGDFRELDLGRYDVVYAYLSPAAMGRLWEQARRDMRPGSVLISNSFAIPGVAPAYTVATGGVRLLLWRM